MAEQQNTIGSVIRAAQGMMRSGDNRGALESLHGAMPQFGGHVDLHMNVAIAQRNLGDHQAALRALDQALAIEPYTFLALLSKGFLLDQLGQSRPAAEVLRNALRIAPPENEAPQALAQQIAIAREMVDKQSQAMAEHLHEEMEQLLTEFSGENLGRFRECIDITAGTRQVYNAEPIQLHYPQLPAIPFFDRSHFPWFEELEAATDVIRDELTALLDAGLPGFKPYIQYAPGTPENQFAALNHNSEWSSLWLWKDGDRQEEAIAQCPKTAAVLEQLPLCDQPEFAPTALFSALAPRTRIPPHTGSTNTRLLVHLPLVLPGPAGFRVGNETREWRMGEAWAFDDTIEHEAWNDADETRVIMIFDTWNPLLTEAERALVRRLLISHRDWLRS